MQRLNRDCPYFPTAHPELVEAWQRNVRPRDHSTSSGLVGMGCWTSAALLLDFLPMGKRKHIYTGPNRVREFRKRRKLTLQKAAPLIGLSWAHLARIESGERELNTIWMERIGKALECAPADLLPPEMGGLSEVERQLVQLMRGLPEPNRRAIEAAIESQRPFLLKTETSGLLPFPEAD